MPGRDFGPGAFHDGGHVWLGLAFMGVSLLFWVGVIALGVWAARRWLMPRLRGAPLMTAFAAGPSRAYVGGQPSAIETLRHRYAMGEIDAPTFEQMVERILASEARERQGEQPLTPRDAEIYNT